MNVQFAFLPSTKVCFYYSSDEIHQPFNKKQTRFIQLLFYLSKSRSLLAVNSSASSYYLAKTEVDIVFWHEYYAL